MITGKTFIDWGFESGSWFKDALVYARRMEAEGASEMEIIEEVRKFVPPEKIGPRTDPAPYSVFIEAENEVERTNVDAVIGAMDKLMCVPTVKSGAVMPDACPAGVIPVGGVVATENAIHPGFHSADICCSMAITVLKDEVNLKHLLDVAEKVTHFGPGKRSKSEVRRFLELRAVLSKFEDNPFLKGLEDYAETHFMTQGDGNHFLFVGYMESTGSPAIVTHHGSRSLGAQLYKRGMTIAKRETDRIAKGINPQAAWIPADTLVGEQYWEALQVTREWTRANHFAIHNEILSRSKNSLRDRMWNEHNFVFRKSDGLFYHAKGATPSFAGFSPDDVGLTLIPMNMAEPILITAHSTNEGALEFAPHGAGRNVSRTQFLKENSPNLPEDIDIRFWCGAPDKSELPQAYKNASQVVSAIEKHNLAKVVDRVMPYGSIMAGDWEKDAPWRKK